MYFRCSSRRTHYPWALVLLLSACRGPSSEPRVPAYEHATRLLRSEKLQPASVEAERGFAAAPQGSKLAWNFRLLRVEILLAQREAKQALFVLGDTIPSGTAWTEQAARFRLCQAHAALLLSQNGEARKYLDQAQALADSLPSRRISAQIELRRASLATATADFGAARRHLLRVLDDPDTGHDPALRMSATGNMGFLLLRSGRADEAIPWLQQTLSQAQALDAEASLARALGNLGSCFFRLGDLDRAVRNFEQAESRFAITGNRFERQIWLGNIGNIEESKQDYDAAARHYRQALDISRQLGSEFWSATWLNNLAAVSLEREDWNSAEAFNNQAFALKHRVGDEAARSYSLINAGRVAVGRRQYRRAEEVFLDVLRHPPFELTLVLDAHAGLAETYAAQRRDRAAEIEFQAAIAVVARQQTKLLDEQNKLTWFASLIRVYQQYVEFLMDRNRTSAALEIVQSSRARVLAERLERARPLMPPPTALDLQRMAARSESTLLVYWTGRRKSYAWAITANSIRNYDLPPETELRSLVSEYDAFIQQLRDPLNEETVAGQTLYRILVAPAHVTTTSVLLAPDGPLYSLNFATLPVPDAHGCHYWIEDAQIAIAPSFASEEKLKPIRQKASLLLIGDPVAADPEFPALAFADHEMNSIEQSLPGVRRVVYERSKASPESYLQSRPGDFSLIHFVAHADANQDQPLESAVVLSRNAGLEYRLFARDIVRIPLHADLVTISACRSAGARTFAGEGLVGISWAFLKSGARNVIGGLWDVNDRSTAQLMAAMYGELARGTQPADALRTAQLTMLRSKGVYRKPTYWGSFEIFQASF